MAPHLAMTQQKPTPVPDKASAPEYGLFKDGQWYCNCPVRRRAAYRIVTKVSPNNGRGFYACPDQFNGCGFFLFREDAEDRSGTKGAVEEPMGRLRRSASDQSISKFFRRRSDHVENEGQAPPSLSQPLPAKNDDMLPDDLSSGEEAALIELADKAVATPKTPQRSQSRTVRPVTPPNMSSKQMGKRKFEEISLLSDESSGEERLASEILRKSIARPANITSPTVSKAPAHEFNNGLPTPDSKHKGASASYNPQSQSAKRQRFNATPTTGPRASFSSSQPTPQLGNPFLSSPPTLSPQSQRDRDDSVSQDITSLLQAQNIEPCILRAVQERLNKHTARVKGIVAARDMLRANKQSKEEQIARLQNQIAQLEAKVKVYKDRHTGLRAKMLQVYQDS